MQENLDVDYDGGAERDWRGSVTTFWREKMPPITQAKCENVTGHFDIGLVVFNPFNLKSDQYQISPCNINAL